MNQSFFYLASTVGKHLHLDAATINKSGPNCAKVKVLVDLLSKFNEYVEMEFKSSSSKRSRLEQVKIQYEFML